MHEAHLHPKMNHDGGRRLGCAAPFFLRRRLSAPETIMRKHLLAQERSSSQESHKSSDFELLPDAGGSDPNLSARRQRQNDIRKSTLMRRFWQNSKGSINFPSSFSEWQYTLKAKLNGLGAPEHRASTRSLSSESPKRATLRNSPRRKHPPKSDEDSYIMCSSNAPESTSNNTSRTDSYPLSTQTDTESGPNNNPLSTRSITKAYRINGGGISDVTDNTKIPALPIKYQFVIDEKPDEYEVVQPPPESVTNNNGSKTNLNVITNVQLSQSTLNMIFNQVMQDVLKNPPSEQVTTAEQVVKQKAYNFNFKFDNNVPNLNDSNIQREEVRKISEDKFISEINAGSPYKRCNSPSVQRLSAQPCSSSMEVNISSNDSFDKDSDNNSLVDSLEDPSSPRFKDMSKQRIDQDNGQNFKKSEVIHEEIRKKTVKKSSVFYIPIDEKYPESESHVVSEHFPSKLKERLLKRQMKREEKRMQERLKQFDIENGNTTTPGTYFSTSPESSTTHKSSRTTSTLPSRSTKRNASSKRTTLPEINLKKDYNKSFRSTYTQRSLNRYRDSVENTNKNKSPWLPKTTKTEQKSKSLTTTKNKQATTSKHIEILEIMEIVEPDRSIHLTPKSKSRIPILQNSVTKLPKLKPKPAYLDIEEISTVDPKLDQLIANILIDSLNHEESTKRQQSTEGNQKATTTSNNNNTGNLVEQAAEILTKQVLDNNNLEASKLDEHDVQSDDIPKGWITFYMLQKNQSPESTSDEGSHRVFKKTSTKSTQYLSCEDDRISEESDSEAMPLRLNQRTRNVTEGWSVTFNRNGNLREAAPDIEMKFKFPQLSQHNKPMAVKKTKQSDRKREGLNFHDACANISPSEINKSRQYLKDPSTSQLRRRRFLTITPRPTKTSRQRTLLHRQRSIFHDHFVQEGMPEILAVNGNALNQIRRLPKLSEDDLKQLLLSLRQKQENH